MTITESAPASKSSSMTPLERLLVEVCTDTKSLATVSLDPAAAFRAAGASDYAVSCLEKQRGSWISLALSVSQPVPTQDQIDAFLAQRVREDAFFADRLRTEPKRILERSFSTRFPNSAIFDVIEVAGYPSVVVTGLLVNAKLGSSFTPYADVDIDTDTDTDTDTDIDVDVDTDAIVDIDTDIDVDIDVDTDNVVDNVIDTDNSTIAGAGASDARVRVILDDRWNAFWSSHEAMWASRDDRSVSQ